MYSKTMPAADVHSISIVVAFCLFATESYPIKLKADCDNMPQPKDKQY